ncbi:glycosyltransferase [Sulfobacillus harzensis]|uniref:Glycosyltransferase family 1 protein n=1 Tax=Sulfobacillus harzensis TaxID=2729629 RepID=A0A7Y0Q3G9_9FIRM|nr:glycosyltransferase [Sulfobacillus harzensis]NMP22966.1 glycosyltransferase family 1 protein [Sulfobacillus harzensis]
MIRRVLQISLHADPLTYGDSGAVGGQQILIRELVKHIQAHGYGVDVLTAQKNPLWPEKFSLGHLGQVVRLQEGLEKNNEAGWSEVVDALSEQALAWLKESGRSHQLIHSHYWISGLVAERIHQETGLPWIHSPVKMAEWTQRPGEMLQTERVEVERRLLREATAVVVSYLSEADIIHQANPSLPVYVVPPGVDPTQFFSRDAGPVLRTLSLKRRPVIYVGRLELARGLRQALESLGRRDLPEDFVLLVLGGTRREVQHGEPVLADLRVLKERLGTHVQFVGGMPHRGVAPYIAASQVLVAPNQGPTLGMAVLESLASGVPVVGTRVPGVQDWVESGTNGFLVERNDMEGLWEQALDLWADPTKARRMGSRGQEKVHGSHTVAHMAEQMVACYQEVTGNGRDQVGVGF